MASEASSQAKPKQSCQFCKRSNHSLHDCRDIMKVTLTERQEFIKKNGLCFGCLSHGHLSKDCTAKSVCRKCKGKHPTCLHGDYQNLNLAKEKDQLSRFQSQSHIKVSEAKSGTSAKPSLDSGTTFRIDGKITGIKSAMIVPVYLSSEEEPDKKCLVYALLDTQSDTTFILDEIAEKMNFPSQPARLKLSTMTSTSVIDCKKYSGLMIQGVNSGVKICLPLTYSRSFIPVHKSHIPTPEVVMKWPHLECLKSEILPLQDCEVGLLIGYNCAQALAPRDFISGDGDQPFAIKSDLGWSIVGKTCTEESDYDEIGTSHRIVTMEVPEDLKLNTPEITFPNQVQYICQAQLKEEIILPQVCKILESDFSEKYKDNVMSQEDIRFLKIMSEEICQDHEGYYQMPLPFCENNPNLPNNESMAFKRLEHLKRRFQSNKKYYTDYKNFIEDILQHGDAEQVPPQEQEKNQVWYIPHHGVYHPKKPEKIRVVFDCSARFKGTALNDHLLQGPDLNNPLIGVLCRFRENPVAFMSDIERMFHQFRVKPGHRDYLRFLWWKNGDYNSEVVKFRMKVHLFGAASSPGCANYGLKKVAQDYCKEFESEVSSFITNDFYVDDGLKSVETVSQAIDLIEGARKLCAKGNLRLHKFVTNNHKVLMSIPPSERSQNVKKMNLNFEDLAIERALGIEWCVNSDTFQFRLILSHKPFTRRGILSTVASVYDPLGCLSPFVLLGKQILQEMCRENAGWEKPLSDQLRPKWE